MAYYVLTCRETAHSLTPASFMVTAADLHPTTRGNRIFKFADDTYLVVPAANSSSRLGEVSHVEAWASRNNLRLNRTKSKELIFIREKCGQSSQPPSPCPDIERVSCAKVLGITLNDRLSATDHVNNLLTSCRFDNTFYYFGNKRQIKDWPIV